MRLGISNIAWDTKDDALIADLLRELGIDAIDVAPGKYFQNLESTEARDVIAIRKWWEGKGIEITGMQSLLFGATGLNIFSEINSQQTVIRRLGNICKIAAALGATRLVFGSPKNRDRGNLNICDANKIAADFFRRVGDEAQRNKVLICLEPNPKIYSSNFMTNSYETADVVKQVQHPSIKMQLDTGAITVNEEDPNVVLANFHSLVGHVHASEPHLVPLGTGTTNHRIMSEAIQKHLGDTLVTVEMLSPAGRNPLEFIEPALQNARHHYHSSAKSEQTK